jgi:hypothetical protein
MIIISYLSELLYVKFFIFVLFLLYFLIDMQGFMLNHVIIKLCNDDNFFLRLSVSLIEPLPYKNFDQKSFI